MEQIEHLSTIQTLKGNIYNIINHDIQCSSSVSEAWNSLIPGDSCWKTDLLNEVVRLWTTSLVVTRSVIGCQQISLHMNKCMKHELHHQQTSQWALAFVSSLIKHRFRTCSIKRNPTIIISKFQGLFMI